MKREIIDTLITVVTLTLVGGVIAGGFMIHDGLGVILGSAGLLFLWDTIVRQLP